MSGVKGMRKLPRFSVEYQDRLRGKIQAGMLLKKLRDHVLGRTEMSQTQVTAALGLLRKVLPELQNTEVTGTVIHFSEALDRIAKARNQLEQDEPLPIAAPLQGECVVIESNDDHITH